MWTKKNRALYDRSNLRCPSDLTDDEWHGAFDLTRRTWRRQADGVMREVMNGLVYVLSTDCQWRAIPKDLPPRSTIYGYFDLWTYDGTLDRIHHGFTSNAVNKSSENPVRPPPSSIAKA
jgi:transposase